ncbi:MAG TPA: hypothetical protein DCF68_22990 [Cyanothece sp. UBA12306]|nr:hypothetical protein [Cyanothece sp. UBA12306]
MAGFFGLFGGRKAQYVDEIDLNASQEPERKEAYFLKPDEAQTLGNKEFMQKSYTIRRTFPKRPGGKGGEIVQEISSMAKKQANSTSQGIVSGGSQANSSPTSAEKSKRSSEDNSMDMFRKMAQDIKK